MSDFSPRESRPKRVLTEQQQKLLDVVFDHGGDAIKAAKAVGFANPYEAVKRLSDELRELAEYHMARLALKATCQIEDVLDSKGAITQANEKLKAAQLILDRTNPKVEKVDVNAQVKGAIFVLPDKRPLDESTGHNFSQAGDEKQEVQE